MPARPLEATAAEGVRQAGAIFLPAAGAKLAMIDPRDIADVAAVALSDPVAVSAPALSDLVVSVYLPNRTVAAPVL